MESSQIIQITIVGVIVLLAIVWAIVKIIGIGKKKEGCNCGTCGQATDCAARELAERAKKQKALDCHDGRSARN